MKPVELVGRYFRYEDELWRCVRWQGFDMYDLKSEVDGRLICIPIDWAKLID